MTTQQIILTVFEFSLVVALVMGAIYEHQIIKFEKMLFKKIKKLWEVIR